MEDVAVACDKKTRPGRRGMTLVVVLVSVLGLALVAVAAMTFIQSQSRGLQHGINAQRAAYAANAGFNLSIGKLLEIDQSLAGRWYAGSNGKDFDCFAREYAGGLFEVFVTDVFNEIGELEGLCVIARGIFPAGGSSSEPAIVAGMIRPVPAAGSGFMASVLHKDILRARDIAARYDANPELYSAEGNLRVANGCFGLSKLAYGSHIASIVGKLRNRSLGAFHFENEQEMKCLAALLVRAWDLDALIEIGRTLLTLNRGGRLDKLLENSRGVHLTKEDFLSILRAVDEGGPEPTDELIESALRGLERSRLELLVIYQLLMRISALEGTMRIDYKDTRYAPKALALMLAQYFYELLTGERCTIPTIEGIMHVLLRLFDATRYCNVLNRFFYLMGHAVCFVDPATGAAGDEQPLRGGLTSLMRRYVFVDPRRIPFSENSVECEWSGRSFRDCLLGNGEVVSDAWFERALSTYPDWRSLISQQFRAQLDALVLAYLKRHGLLDDETAEALIAKMAGSNSRGPGALYGFLDSADVLATEQSVKWHTLALPRSGESPGDWETQGTLQLTRKHEPEGERLSDAAYQSLLTQPEPDFVDPTVDFDKFNDASGEPPPDRAFIPPPSAGNMLDAEGFGRDDSGLPGAGAGDRLYAGHVGEYVNPALAVDENGNPLPRPGGDMPDFQGPDAQAPPNPPDDPPPAPGGDELDFPPVPFPPTTEAIADWLEWFREVGRTRPVPEGISTPADYFELTWSGNRSEWDKYIGLLQGTPLLDMSWEAVLEGSAEAP